MNLVDHIAKQIEFSRKTFGPGLRTDGILDHICKEILEVRENPTDLEEWVDIIMLALDGAWRAGYSGEEISSMLEFKLRKNMEREWPDWRTTDPNKAIEHKRES